MWNLRRPEASNVHNLEAPFKALHGIIAHGRPPLVGHKSGVPKIGDRVRDESEVEFLFVVDFLAAGHTRYVDVADAVNVIAQGPRYVAIRDLSVVNIKQDFDARRIDALAHIQPPCHMIEDLIGTLVCSHLGVRNFHANVNVLLFGVALHAVQYRDSVIRAFFPGHAAPFAGDRNENGASRSHTHVDSGMRGVFNLGVDFLADQPILETGSRARHHAGRQAILREDWHLLLGGQINALETNAGENLAPLLELGR